MAFDISLQDLTLSYQGNDLFRGFSFSLQQGQWAALLGVSGVGKSTLLRYIAGLPTGCDQANTNTSRNIAYMAQDTALMPWLNVLDNVLLEKRLQKIKVTADIKKRALNLLEQIGLASNAKQFPHELSGGMKQRVSLVRTLLADKAIILMDEPFAALDIINRLKLQDLTAELLANKTVLLVTHDPLEALRLADDVYVLSGRPAILSDPIHVGDVKPRASDNIELIKKQAALLKLLQGEA